MLFYAINGYFFRINVDDGCHMKLNIKYLLVFANLLAAGAPAQDVSIMSSIIGVSHVQEPTGFHIAGMQYNADSTNTPASIYGDTLPFGSKIYRWSGNYYDSSEYNEFYDFDIFDYVVKWDVDFSLGDGEGYWVYAPLAVDTYLNGDVPLADAITNTISVGFQICSYPYPVDRVVTNLGFTPSYGDRIYVWNGTGYDYAEYNQFYDFDIFDYVVKWDNETLHLDVGQGFWYKSTVATNWVAQRPFSLN